MNHLFKDCRCRESLRARSRDMQQLYQEAQVEAGSWEDIVTRKADPVVTPFSRKYSMTLYTDF